MAKVICKPDAVVYDEIQQKQKLDERIANIARGGIEDEVDVPANLAVREILARQDLDGGASSLASATPTEINKVAFAVMSAVNDGKTRGRALLDASKAMPDRAKNLRAETLEKMIRSTSSSLSKDMENSMKRVARITEDAARNELMISYLYDRIRQYPNGQGNEMMLVEDLIVLSELLTKAHQLNDAIKGLQTVLENPSTQFDVSPDQERIRRLETRWGKMDSAQRAMWNIEKILVDEHKKLDNTIQEEHLQTAINNMALEYENTGHISRSMENEWLWEAIRNPQARARIAQHFRNPGAASQFMAWHSLPIERRLSREGASIITDFIYGTSAGSASFVSTGLAFTMQGLSQVFKLAGSPTDPFVQAAVMRHFGAIGQLKQGAGNAWNYVLNPHKLKGQVDEVSTTTGTPANMNLRQKFPELFPERTWDDFTEAGLFRKAVMMAEESALIAHHGNRMFGRGFTIMGDEFWRPASHFQEYSDAISVEAKRRALASGVNLKDITYRDAERMMQEVEKDEDFMKPLGEAVQKRYSARIFLGDINPKTQPTASFIDNLVKNDNFSGDAARWTFLLAFWRPAHYAVSAGYGALGNMIPGVKGPGVPNFLKSSINRQWYDTPEKGGLDLPHNVKKDMNANVKRIDRTFGLTAIAGLTLGADMVLGNVEFPNYALDPNGFIRNRIENGHFYYTDDNGETYRMENWGNKYQEIMKIVMAGIAFSTHPQIDIRDRDAGLSERFGEQAGHVIFNFLSDHVAFESMSDIMLRLHGEKREAPAAVTRTMARMAIPSLVKELSVDHSVDQDAWVIDYEAIDQKNRDSEGNLMEASYHADMIAAQVDKMVRNANEFNVPMIDIVGNNVKKDPSNLWHVKTRRPIRGITQNYEWKNRIQRNYVTMALSYVSGTDIDFDLPKTFYGDDATYFLTYLAVDDQNWKDPALMSEIQYPRTFEPLINIKGNNPVHLTRKQRNMMSILAGGGTAAADYGISPIKINKQDLLDKLEKWNEKGPDFAARTAHIAEQLLDNNYTKKEFLTAFAHDGFIDGYLRNGDEGAYEVIRDFVRTVNNEFNSRALRNEREKITAGKESILTEPYMEWFKRNKTDAIVQQHARELNVNLDEL